MKKLNVSESTKKEIAKFFLRTSVPRILKERSEKSEQMRRMSNAHTKNTDF